MAERLTRSLLDTSVVIGRADMVDPGPGRSAAISVITIGELRAGVRLASDPNTQAARQARFAAVRAAFEPLIIDESVAQHYGDILAAARAQKRTSKATDLLIIATAAATGRVLHTLDEAQAGLARLAGIPVYVPTRPPLPE
jgi:predicted nucleic acid-binding protein